MDSHASLLPSRLPDLLFPWSHTQMLPQLCWVSAPNNIHMSSYLTGKYRKELFFLAYKPDHSQFFRAATPRSDAQCTKRWFLTFDDVNICFSIIILYTANINVIIFLFYQISLWQDSSISLVLSFSLFFFFSHSLSSTGSPPPSQLDICCLATPAPIRASGLSSPLQWNQPCMQMADMESSNTTSKLRSCVSSQRWLNFKE